MGPFLGMAGVIGLGIGIFGLFRPIPRLRIKTRKDAGIAILASLLGISIGIALTPQDNSSSSALS